MNPRTKLLLSLFCFIFCFEPVFADSIRLKDGKEIKGIIVEDYADRAVISTFEGEKTVFKKNIGKILYDLAEQNLVSMGDAYLSRREYAKAYFYYEKAHRVNPDFKPAREKMNYVMGSLFRKGEEEKMDSIKRRQESETWWRPEGPEEEDFREDLWERLGLAVGSQKGRIKIKKVLEDSPAAAAGAKEGDVLISAWGQLAGYMSEEEASRLLLKENIGEIKIDIERDIALKKAARRRKSYKDIIGGRLAMLIDGLTVVDIESGGPGEKAGLEKEDLIVAINGKSTRYMPLKDAIRIIKDRKTDTVVFSVKRDITMWRK